MKMISVVVPVYFNEGSLPDLFQELQSVEDILATKDVGMEWIFIDDGSQDRSLQVLLELKRRRPATKVVKLTRNFGAVHASKAGLGMVTGEAFSVLAADLQDAPDLLVTMVDRWLAGAKYVIAERTDRRDPLVSRCFAWIYYRLIRWLVVPGYPRGGYDVALMDRAMLSHLKNSNKNINPSLFAYWLGFKPEVIFYERRQRIHGQSRWTFSKRFKYFIDSILGFSIVPIRLILLLGLAIAIPSFGYGMWVVVHALLHGADVRGFPTLVALVTFLLGLIIVMLGVIGEYLWRIFDEISRRPEAVVEEVY